MIKYLIIFGLAYLAYRVIRPLIISGRTHKTGKKNDDKSLGIPDEDIRDAEFREMNED